MAYCSSGNLAVDLVFIATAISLCLVFIYQACNRNKWLRQCLVLGYYYHLAISYFFISNAVTTTGGSDSLRFYDLACSAASWSDSYGTAINFMIFLVYPFNNLLGLSFLSTSLIFATFAYVGFAAFLIAAVSKVSRFSDIGFWAKSGILYLIFSPSIHYWSGGITKESITIVGIGLVALAFSRKRPSVILICLSLVLLIHIRPYVGVIAVFALLTTMLVGSREVKLSTMLLVIAPTFIIGLFSMEFLVSHLGVESLSAVEIEDRLLSSKERWGGGSYINLDSMNTGEKLFAFLFRPLFYDASGPAMIYASIDNFILLTLVFFCLISIWKSDGSFKPEGVVSYFCFIIFFSLLIVLATTTPNLGTVARKKILVVIPLLTYLLCQMKSRFK